jgi:hypothetical protein
MAVTARSGRERVAGVIFHSDRGSTYTAHDFTTLCDRPPVRWPPYPARHGGPLPHRHRRAAALPELGETHFERGKMPYFDSVRRYLDTENALGAAKFDDTELAATQFLGMISNYVIWPRMLLMNWSPDDASMAHVVDEAVLMMEARYGVANTTN